ncbi:ankyrin repeat domain-containing protein 50 [Biomphalaria glabrata]|uniref:Ankyrin repeat domain-containing protein 50-like n=1 Tax=Biomphalaria glabrata TaxID=6526 RepID=A0A9W3BE14_BIOGL|nr:ankyrin repeat domain-containing protein 50-like [Biomphalaria glabrata]XP_055897727.1 ankyrin repeat domain-containing protein 50-like [Biomphalaria glabrata]XP_055897728.1 ankyrin repeat domain-containing protein 50-like [Biomphalaria glabrata]XP_055897729.1 ankyrin repeat domain-containing protein 50-like [Biomphalaria glabrata]KAI8727768.1 ankyrin repeat domain-containing protein 50-like [Biomphalaria glabrata]
MESQDWFTALHEGDLQVVNELMLAGADVNEKSKDGSTSLMVASFNGYWDIVELLAQHGADVNERNNEGNTALMMAAENGFAEIVQMLMLYGADADVKRNDGWNALMIASVNGNTEVAEALLNPGNRSQYIEYGKNGFEEKDDIYLTLRADVNLKRYDGLTPLMISSQNGNTEMIDLLIKYGARLNDINHDKSTSLMLAAQSGSAESVGKLLQYGSNPHVSNSHGTTALIIATIQGCCHVVEILIKYKVAVDAKDISQWTALFYAIRYRYSEIVNLLLLAGANVNEIGTDGSTPLSLSLEFGNVEIVKMLSPYASSREWMLKQSLIPACRASNLEVVTHLLQSGADVNEMNSESETALMITSQRNYVEIVRELLNFEADINCTHLSTRNTVLMMASEKGHSETIDVLLDYGAGINDVNIFGLSPLMFACLNGHDGAVEKLLNRGAKINDVCSKNKTALMMASEKGFTSIVELLILRNALLDVSCKDGSCALILSADNGHSETVKLLLDKGAAKDKSAALIKAALKNHHLTVKVLLDAGARVDHVDNTGWTAMMYASKFGHYSTFEVLITHKSTINNLCYKEIERVIDIALKYRRYDIHYLLISTYNIKSRPSLKNSTSPSNKRGHVDPRSGSGSRVNGDVTKRTKATRDAPRDGTNLMLQLESPDNSNTPSTSSGRRVLHALGDDIWSDSCNILPVSGQIQVESTASPQVTVIHYVNIEKCESVRVGEADNVNMTHSVNTIVGNGNINVKRR